MLHVFLLYQLSRAGILGWVLLAYVLRKNAGCKLLDCKRRDASAGDHAGYSHRDIRETERAHRELLLLLLRLLDRGFQAEQVAGPKFLERSDPALVDLAD